MLPGILAFGYLLLIVVLIRLVRSHRDSVDEEARDIPGSDMDINYCERPYIDKYI
jgi:hypothetical protein